MYPVSILSFQFSYPYGGGEYASPVSGTGGSGYYNHPAMTNYNETSPDYADSTTTTGYDPRPTQTQVDAVTPDTPSVTVTGGVMSSGVTSGKFEKKTNISTIVTKIEQKKWNNID